MKEEEHGMEPENQTICECTGGGHAWLWNEDQCQYECDECGILEGNQ